MYMRYLYLMMILYTESKKLSQIVHNYSEILLFLRVLDSFGQFWTTERFWTGLFKPVQKGWFLPLCPKPANPVHLRSGLWTCWI